ncbi:MAG: MBL fold metallo-hydrolase [Oscillospiraceae bacterium]|nr:MBL fold metallo-hydrolase [Oscillospiraceae bacterium]
MADPVIRTGHINLFAQSDVTCYIIRGAEGDLLVDTGFYMNRRALLQWLSVYSVKWIFLTHAHPDHDWNAAAVAQKTGAKILLHEADSTLIRNFRSQPVHPTADRWRLRNLTQNFGGALVKSPPYKPDILFGDADGGLLRQYGFDAEIVHLPGHTLGSSGILCGDVLYCGDAFTAIFGRPDITPHAADLPQMNASLRKILEIRPKWLACGHGFPVKLRDAEPVIRTYLQEHAHEI